MTPPKRKAESRLRKERISRRRYSHRQYRKRPNISRRVQTYQPISVRKMVYRLLGDKHNQARGERRVSDGRRFYRKIRKYENDRHPSYDSSPRRDSSPSIEGSEYTRSVATSVENLSEMIAGTNSSRGSSSEISSVSNISVKPIAIVKTVDNTRALLKKKSLVQVINNYIKAGIAEGKRQAKKYIRKALSFGVNSGYLIPTDSKGQVIRVSPLLMETRRGDTESRKRRRRARRGEEDLIASDAQRRQLSPPWTGKKVLRREDSPKPETSPQKKKKRVHSKSPERIQKKKNLKKKPVDRILWRTKRNKKNSSKKKSKITSNLNLSKSSPTKSEENVPEMRRTRSSCKHLVERKQDQRDHQAKSPRARMDEDENARKNNRGSSNEDKANGKFSGNEVSERIPIGRRKSSSSRDDASRNINASSRSLAREVEDRLDVPIEETLRNDSSVNAI